MKTKLCIKHYELVKSGKLLEAKRLFKFIQHQKITLGLDDVDWLVERTINRCGLKPVFVSGRTGIAKYRF